jgi:hypothetical protein
LLRDNCQARNLSQDLWEDTIIKSIFDLQEEDVLDVMLKPIVKKEE